MQFITFIGFAGSGKDTCGDMLVSRYGFVRIAFADSLKDTCAALFHWDRRMLEGDTAESREWREKVDPWWAKKLNIHNFTPRWALRNIGTEVIRQHFHNNLWTLNVERKVSRLPSDCPGVVFTDARFPNEFDLVRSFGSKIIRVRRGPEPAWFQDARNASLGDEASAWNMRMVHEIHDSEWRWCGLPIDGIIENDSDLPTLYERAESWIQKPLV